LDEERKHFLQIATDQAINQAKIFLENERAAKAESKLKKKELKRKEEAPEWVKSINAKLDKLDSKRPKKERNPPPFTAPTPSPSPPTVQPNVPQAPKTPRIYSQMFPGRHNV
jgi:hypothetical protein